MLIFAFQLLVYIVLLVGTTLYLAFCWATRGHLGVRHQGTAFGLLASPLGFGFPYAIASGIGWLFYGGRPLLPVSDWPALLRVPFIAFILFGPLIGPPVAVGLAAAWYVRRRSA